MQRYSLIVALVIAFGLAALGRTWMDLVFAVVAFIMCLLVYGVEEARVLREANKTP